MTKPSIHLVAAMTRDRVIGHQGAMPWHLPRDLKHFKEVTLGHPVVMGRKTFDSIVASLGKPLPGRLNVVISRHQPTVPEGVCVYSSLDEALSELAKRGEAVVDVIGGGQIYELAMPRADRLYITLIDAEIQGDTWFPEIDKTHWQVSDTQTHPPDEANAHAMTFVTFDRANLLVDDQAN